MRKLLVAELLICFLMLGSALRADTPQWGVFELSRTGPASGNPFVDTTLEATFTYGSQSLKVRGFYDGGGTYRIRFMPPAQGVWRYSTRSNSADLDGIAGEFTCSGRADGNHGPVQVRDKFHFAYADGTPMRPIGTTAYGWVHSSIDLQEQTLTTLKASAFNKVRMCLFPTKYAESSPPAMFPFVTGSDGKFDLERFDVTFFQHLEKRIAELAAIGVQADLILFHPYDEGQMGFDRMPAEADDRYLRYAIARLGASHNVWWSLANEFDLMKEKKDSDWDRFFQVVQEEDPYPHLRSIHHSQRMYDTSKPWVSHASIQNGLAAADFGRAVLYRQSLNKPIVLDEVKYEGNIERRWGQLSGEEMLLRFWMGTIAGTYVGHGESLRAQGKPVWLGRGGSFSGESPRRIAFLKQILDTAPVSRIDPIDQYYETKMGGKAGEFYLIYFGRETPTTWHFALPREGMADGIEFRADVIDTWNMTITPVQQTFRARKHSEYIYRADPDANIDLPGKPYIVIRLTRISGPTTRPADSAPVL